MQSGEDSSRITINFLCHFFCLTPYCLSFQLRTPTTFIKQVKSTFCRSRCPSGVRRESGPVPCWDCGFQSRRGHGCLSLVSVVHVCCQVDHSVRGVQLSVVCINERDYPLSYGVPVRERYGSTLLPATREQHDQNSTQSH